jgi:hypothetical protein
MARLRNCHCRLAALVNPAAVSCSSFGQSAANPAFERTAACALRLLAVPSSLRSSAAAQRERYAAFDLARAYLARWPLSAVGSIGK